VYFVFKKAAFIEGEKHRLYSNRALTQIYIFLPPSLFELPPSHKASADRMADKPRPLR